MPLSENSVGIYPETHTVFPLSTHPHATCLGTFGHSRLGSLGHCGLVLG